MDFSEIRAMRHGRRGSTVGGLCHRAAILPCIAAAALAAGCFDHATPRTEVVARSLGEAEAAAGSVTFLDLHEDEALAAFPEGLGRFPELRRLSVRGRTAAAKVPPTLAEAKSLAELDLADTGLRSLPDCFGAMPALRRVYLSDNGLSELPTSLLAAPALEYLNLDRNALETLPDGIGELSSLKWVRLNGNKLGDLPASAANWKKIRRLYLRGNGLRNVPAAILAMESLEELDLGDNDIIELPEALFRLPHLRRLDLDGNSRLDHLPGNIGEAAALSHLFLFRCALQPEEQARVRAALPDPVRRFIAF